jgi:carbon monoxide dehydrogenase subunit G
MEIKLEKRYPLTVGADRAWAVLLDVPRVAACMPGAEITEQVDATHYKGKVKVKVGPANAAFGGDIEVRAVDAAAHSLQLFGKGADRGGSTASMDLTAVVEAGATAESSVLVGTAVVVVNGKFAQFGGRLMVQVSDMLLAQFADNFNAAAAAMPGAPAQEAAAPAAGGAAAPGMAAQPGANAQARETQTVPAPARETPTVPAPTREINALAILWALIKGWCASRFGKRA